jgi:hypothetical protein
VTTCYREPPQPRIVLGRSGFLATSPKGAAFRIGVIGKTEEEAASLFRGSWAEWVKLREGMPDSQKGT